MEVRDAYRSYREGLGPRRAAWLYEKDAVLALREHHLSQGMQTIWDSQSQQRLIVDHDEHGDLARIMVFEHHGPRGIGIDPYHAHVMRDTTGCVVRAGDVHEHMYRFHPLRVEYDVDGQPLAMWMPWLSNPCDNDDFYAFGANDLALRCVGYPCDMT